MHAYKRHSFSAVGAVDKIHVNHRSATMGLTFGTGVHARLAADAPRRINVEFVAKHNQDLFNVGLVAHSGGCSAFRMRHAETLNSGILLRGSSVRCVSLLT